MGRVVSAVAWTACLLALAGARNAQATAAGTRSAAGDADAAAPTGAPLEEQPTWQKPWRAYDALRGVRIGNGSVADALRPLLRHK